MKRFKITLIYFLPVLLFIFSCTDLEVEEKDSIVVEDTSGKFTGVQPGPTLESAYADLRAFGDQANIYALNEVTSDELLVPTRGTDWGDNGVWRTLHQHTWDPTHQYVLNTWNNLNASVFKLNQLLAPESGANATQLAEGKFLRAFNMYFILDLYGQIPFRGVNDGVDVDPQVFSASEAFDFIIKDLTEALPDLPSIGPGPDTKEASKAAAHFLLAKLYLNKHVFLNQDVSAADMTKVIDNVDAIKAEGFDLRDGYFDLFRSFSEIDPSQSETIFYTDASFGNRIWNGLHYSQITSDNQAGGWNGFSTTAEFYALFEGSSDSNAPGSGQEERRGYVPTDGLGYGFLVGQQYDRDGNALKDRSGNPLVFTKDFPGLAGNNERTGIRIIKYHPYDKQNPEDPTKDNSFRNYYILFRYADAHLMKAEAILRGGSSSESALDLVNELRAIRDADPLSSVSLDDILDERGRELYIEGWRRNDQIRFGTYNSPWAMKDNTEGFRSLFPIPATALSSNPNLVQNPGY